MTAIFKNLKNLVPARSNDDHAYRRTTNRLGAALLVHSVLFVLLDDLMAGIMKCLSPFFYPRTYAVVADLLDSAAYLLAFMLPVLVYRWMTPRSERRTMPLSPTLPHKIVPIIFAAVTIIHAAAILNSKMLSFLEFDSFSSEYIWTETVVNDYEGVLLFISTAIVPAFCEEFLFRGLVLNELRPYGKTTAILGSALLFGIMHQNPGQLFYATLAGLVLGYLCYETGSVWAGVLVHMFNNLTSVMEDIIYERLPPLAADRLTGAIEVLILGLGVISLAFLLLRMDHSGSTAQRTSLIGEPPAPAVHSARALTHPVRDFLTPLMVLFIGVSVLEMIYILILSIILLQL